MRTLKLDVLGVILMVLRVIMLELLVLTVIRVVVVVIRVIWVMVCFWDKRNQHGHDAGLRGCNG